MNGRIRCPGNGGSYAGRPLGRGGSGDYGSRRRHNFRPSAAQKVISEDQKSDEDHRPGCCQPHEEQDSDLYIRHAEYPALRSSRYLGHRKTVLIRTCTFDFCFFLLRSCFYVLRFLLFVSCFFALILPQSVWLIESLVHTILLLKVYNILPKKQNVSQNPIIIKLRIP